MKHWKIDLQFIVPILIGLILSSCINSAYSSNDKDFKSEYRYLDYVRIQTGFYKNYNCLILTEYTNSVFCKLTATDNFPLGNDFRININVDKSNIKLEETEGNG